MLVLSRKVDEAIRIGGNVKLTVVAIQGGRVRLGLEGPDDVAFVRDELVKKPVEANLVALAGTEVR